jgi:ATP-dependent Clp protease adapter protein ClpS
MSQTLQHPNLSEDALSGRWMTIIFNDDHTPIDLVVLTVIAATKCSVEEAEIETWEAHHYGKAPIHFSSESECDQVARVLQSIGVKTEVVPEWTE